MSDRSRRSLVAGIFVAAIVIRVLAYAGFALGDDTIYLDAVVRASQGLWPPEFTHWDTRLVMTLPPAVLIRLFGFVPAFLIVVPFVASLAKVVAIFLFARRYFDARTAMVAYALAAVFPGDVIYATHLFPDVVVGACTSIALLAFLAALLDNSPRLSLAAGAALAAGYLTRETIVLDAPLFLALPLLCPGPRRVMLSALTVVVPAITVVLEVALYAWTAGDPLYRVHAVLSQQLDPDNLVLVATPTAGGTFWTDPLLMLVTSHEFGVIMVCGLLAAVLAFRQPDRLPRLLAGWMLAGWVWTSYGTTSITGWVILQRDARYLLEMATPAVLLIALGLRTWRPQWRASALAVLLVTSVIAPTMEQGGTVTTAHRAVLARGLPPDVVFDPQEYVGARWESGLMNPVPFAQLGGVPGRTWASLPGHRFASMHDPAVHTIVIGPLTKPAVVDQVRAAGFVLDDTVHAQVPIARRLIAVVLAQVPSQRARAAKVTAGRALRIFRRSAP